MRLIKKQIYTEPFFIVFYLRLASNKSQLNHGNYRSRRVWRADAEHFFSIRSCFFADLFYFVAGVSLKSEDLAPVARCLNHFTHVFNFVLC